MVASSPEVGLPKEPSIQPRSKFLSSKNSIASPPACSARPWNHAFPNPAPAPCITMKHLYNPPKSACPRLRYVLPLLAVRLLLDRNPELIGQSKHSASSSFTLPCPSGMSLPTMNLPSTLRLSIELSYTTCQIPSRQQHLPAEN